MSGVTVKFIDAEAPCANHLDSRGCIWVAWVGAAGELNVAQQDSGKGELQPIVLAEHIYAPGTWRSAVRQ